MRGERRAHLTGHETGRPDDRRSRFGDVKVVQYHRGRLPTELQGEAGDGFTADRRDAPSGNRMAVTFSAAVPFAGVRATGGTGFTVRAITAPDGDIVGAALSRPTALRRVGHPGGPETPG
jgi:hypothetical protein